jgi:hypothetical protein
LSQLQVQRLGISPVQQVPKRWRFSFDDDEVSLRDLSWPQAVHVVRVAEAGDLAGQSDDVCVSLEFNTASAAVTYMGRDGVILRPYFPRRPAIAQDLRPFFCGSCGVRLGNHEEYLMRFLLNRDDGLRLFVALLVGPSLPAALPEPYPSQPMLPGFEQVAAQLAAERILEWRPIPSREPKEPGTHNESS